MRPATGEGAGSGFHPGPGGSNCFRPEGAQVLNLLVFSGFQDDLWRVDDLPLLGSRLPLLGSRLLGNREGMTAPRTRLGFTDEHLVGVGELGQRARMPGLPAGGFPTPSASRRRCRLLIALSAGGGLVKPVPA